MDWKKEAARQMGLLEVLRQTVQVLENALQVLTPEERLVAQLLLIAPEKGNVQRLCELLGVEQSSVYRRRERVLEKLAQVLSASGLGQTR